MGFTAEKAQHNVKKILWFSFFNWFLILIPVIVPFLKSRGLTMTDVFWLQTVFSATVLILELPSGYLSDMWGRKRTLILAGIVKAAGAVILVQAQSFWDFAVFQVFLAVAISLRSGTDVSLLYDSVFASKTQSSQTSLMGRLMFVNTGSETLASLVGGVLALWSMEWAMWAFAGSLCIPVFIALVVDEPPRQRMQQRTHLHNFKIILRHVFVSDPILRLIFFNTMTWGTATLVMVWAYQHIWEEYGVVLSYFGVLWAISNLSVGLIARLVHRVQMAYGERPLLLALGSFPVLGYAAFAFLDTIWVIAFGLLFAASRAINGTFMKDSLNMRVPSEFRATANSVAQLGMRAIFCVLGPLAGWMIDTYGTQSAMAVLCLVFLVGFVTLIVPLWRSYAPKSAALSAS